jgi:hypothetical protein
MRKLLKPATPASASGSIWCWLPSTQPPQKATIDEALAASGVALEFESGGVGGLGQAVERHVDQRGEAPGGGGERGGAKALPLGAAGLVDVGMRVDQAG